MSRSGALGPLHDVYAGQAGVMNVAVAANGTATFVWVTSRSDATVIRTRAVTPSGGHAAMRPIRHVSGGNPGHDPQIVALPDGRTVIAWAGPGGVHARVRSGLGSLGCTVRLFGKDFDHVRLGVLPGGKVLVGANGLSGVKIRTLSARGWRGPVSTVTGPGATRYSFGVRPDGSAEFLWTRGSLRSYSHAVQTRSRSAGHRFGPPVLLAKNCSFDIHVAVAAKGRAFATWLANCANS